MKIGLSVVLLAALLPIACSSQVENAAQSANATKTSTASAISATEQAANQLYLDDVQDSAGDDATTTTTTDTSVADDVKADRLVHMATKLLSELDSDASGSLSLAEFLVGPAKRAEDTDVDADRKAKMIAKMTEDFNTYAGDDALLSLAELETLLKAVAPRVGCHRQDNFPGQQEERVQQTWADVIAKYDTDGDGLLSQTEYEAMEADRKADREAFEKNHQGHGH